jgi:YfiH family protein
MPPHDDNALSLVASWPAAPAVCALTTLRTGGYSAAPYDSLNLAAHAGDHIDNVRRNRLKLRTALQLPNEPIWLNQHHGAQVIDAGQDQNRDADGAYADRPGVTCAVLTADCLPLLLCNQEGTEVAALHCGWRGLAAGVIEQGLKRFRSPCHLLMAWLGPAISARHYEVGGEVWRAFTDRDATAAAAFHEIRPGKWFCDLYALARRRLAAAGVQHVYGGDCCTYSDQERFFSFRRSGECGRMASLIFMAMDA